MQVLDKKKVIWPDGKIEVQLENDRRQFTAGAVIRGLVKVTQVSDFMALKLLA